MRQSAASAWTSFCDPRVAALALLSGALFLTTVFEVLPLVLGAGLFAALLLFSFLHPDKMLLLSLAVSILVPVDLAFRIQGLFRLGPTRAVLAALILGTALRHFSCRRPLREEGTLPFLGLVALYLFSGLASCFYSVDRPVSIYGVIGRDLVEQFLLLYLLVRHLSYRAHRRAVSNTLLAATGAVCLFAICEALAGYNPLLPLFANPEPEYREGLLRVRSVFFHPIALGCFLNLTMPFALVELLQRREPWRRAAPALLLLVMLATSFLTVSRAPWVCLFLELMVIFGWWGLRSYRRALPTVAAVLLTLAAVSQVYQYSGSFNRLFKPVLTPGQQPESSPEYYRVMLVDAVVEHLHGVRWFYGYGPNAFDKAEVRVRYKNTQQVLTSPDNHYARLLLEYGIFGLGAFILLLSAAIAMCLTTVRKAREQDRLAAVACLAGMVGFAAANATVSLFQMFPFGMLFWLLVAYAWNLRPSPSCGLPGRNAARGAGL